MVGIWAVSASSPLSVGPGGVTLLGFCGYQCTSAKSIELSRADSTVWSHGCGLSAFVTPSGQLPGAVSTTPTLMVGSTAFMAAMYAFTFCAYTDGPQLVGCELGGIVPQWSSGSQEAL